MKPFDQREGFIYLDNEFVEWKEAKIHFLTHGLHYGSACFEGIRIYNGKIFKNLEHAERLLYSASQLDFKIEKTAQEIAEICVETCKKNNIENGYVRPLAWRGSNQMQVGARNSDVRFAVSSWQWPNYDETKKKAGLRFILGLYKRQSAECAPVFAKASGLYVASTLCKNDAENKGFDDCLMLDYRDFVAESSTSNVFFVFGSEIHTPIADCFLNGITRQTVIKLARDLGYTVIERHMKLEELSVADDAFATGTAAEVSKIASVTTRDLNTIYEFKESTVSHHLMEEYKKLVL